MLVACLAPSGVPIGACAKEDGLRRRFADEVTCPVGLRLAAEGRGNTPALGVFHWTAAPRLSDMYRNTHSRDVNNHRFSGGP
jgi:hypothetical protein